uniref:hypothetical protein n=1 Tax=Cephaloticoccus sp. TaxID=1985742 RepID=UPI004049E8D7
MTGNRWNQGGRWLAGPLAILVTGLAMAGGWPREQAYMCGILVLAAILWVTEALPLFVTSLMVIGAETILLANPGGWSGFGFSGAGSMSFNGIISAAANPDRPQVFEPPRVLVWELVMGCIWIAVEAGPTEGGRRPTGVGAAVSWAA